MWIFEIKVKYEYYSAIKLKEILPLMTTWINFEVINLSEISQTEKDRYCRSSLKCGIEKKQKNLIEKEISLVITRGTGWREGESEEGDQSYKLPIIK